MPSLAHLPQYERHLTLAALAHCPRDYWYINEIKHGRLADRAPGESLLLGILVHVGLKALWAHRLQGLPALPSVALDAIDAAPEQASPEIVALAKRGVAQYAAQWTGVRDHWTPIVVEPLDIPPQPWTVLDGQFVSYPDLITQTAREAVLVVDYKTSFYKFEAANWEWHPELLTQCLAAQQLRPGEAVHYMIDYMQRPGRNGTVWSFPVTPVWEFTPQKKTVAEAWLAMNLFRIQEFKRLYRGVLEEVPWPQEISQCKTAWGMCQHYERCFGEVGD